MKNLLQIQHLAGNDPMYMKRAKKQKRPSLFGNLLAMFIKKTSGNSGKNALPHTGNIKNAEGQKEQKLNLYLKQFKFIFSKKGKFATAESGAGTATSMNGKNSLNITGQNTLKNSPVIQTPTEQKTESKKGPAVFVAPDVLLKPPAKVRFVPDAPSIKSGKAVKSSPLSGLAQTNFSKTLNGNSVMGLQKGQQAMGESIQQGLPQVTAAPIPVLSVNVHSDKKAPQPEAVHLSAPLPKKDGGLRALIQKLFRPKQKTITVPTENVPWLTKAKLNQTGAFIKQNPEQNVELSRLKNLDQSAAFQKFSRHVSGPENIPAATKISTPNQAALKTCFIINEYLNKPALRQNANKPVHIPINNDVKVVFNKQNIKKSITVFVKDAQMVKQLKHDIRVVQKLSGEKYLKNIKIEISRQNTVPKELPELVAEVEKPLQGKKVAQPAALIPKSGAETDEAQNERPPEKRHLQQTPAPIHKTIGRKKLSGESPLAAVKNTTIKSTPDPVSSGPSVHKQTVSEQPASTQDAMKNQEPSSTETNDQPAVDKKKMEPFLQHILKQGVQSANESVQLPRNNMNELAGRLREIIQKYDWTKKKLGLKTNFKIENGPVGKMEIQFKEKGKLKDVHILVESEKARTELQKVLPQVQQSLLDKGTILDHITINVTQFAATPEQFRESQKQKTKQTGSATNRKEIADEQNESTLNQRKFGYNTMEVIA